MLDLAAMGIERRQHPRYRIDMHVILHVGGGGRTLGCEAFDISSAGIFVLTTETLSAGSRVDLALIDAAAEETYYLSGKVVHESPGRGLGILLSTLSTRTSGRLMALLARLEAAGPPMGASS